MAHSKLDPIDRKILAELQADGRMTNVELAKRVGISAPPCLRRVRALEEAGYIAGYRALVDARALGLSVVFFVFVQLEQQTDLLARQIRTYISDLRDTGMAICGTPKHGYYIAANAEELEETCAFLHNRAIHSLMLESRLRKIPLSDLLGQLHLPT